MGLKHEDTEQGEDEGEILDHLLKGCLQISLERHKTQWSTGQSKILAVEKLIYLRLNPKFFAFAKSICLQELLLALFFPH